MNFFETLIINPFDPRYNGSETNYQGDESNDAASNCSFDGIEMANPFRQRQYSNILEEEEKETGRDKVDSKETEINSKQEGPFTDQSDNSGSVDRYVIIIYPKEMRRVVCHLCYYPGCLSLLRRRW